MEKFLYTLTKLINNYNLEIYDTVKKLKFTMSYNCKIGSGVNPTYAERMCDHEITDEMGDGGHKIARIYIY